MAQDLPRSQEQRGTAKLLKWGIAIVALLFLGLLAFFVFAPSWRTEPLKRAPEQNQGTNAPEETSPSPGVNKDPQQNSEMPGQQ
ncbi:hypothetical protein [Mesorhizobium sp. ES1-1]|uniref:hypothetical protein n=1 Tax=Mesorhizobium sp. ES1-1 TaxID=2876629 RepID=UPI001CCA7E7E|nr:hypothetical protein [Mesorhizobium sp. ES1-1]MBZ9677517.1 hypothetical protein [Mesorhizobium sp. ES1-1]